MSNNLEYQKRAFDFLFDSFVNQKAFARDEFQKATGWGDVTFSTYFSKHFDSLLIPIGNNQFRLNQAFVRFDTWEKFRRLVSQKIVITSKYSELSYNSFVQFEFFLPLTHQIILRQELDTLFFRNTILDRIKNINERELSRLFPIKNNEKEEDRVNRICDWVSNKFVGYSISHVNGRYRASVLSSMKEVYGKSYNVASKYLVDETTAIVKFVIPCGEGTNRSFLDALNESIASEHDLENSKIGEDVQRIRWLFHELFLKSILQIVQGEDEIWLLESGIVNQLHIWRVKKDW